MILFDDLTPIGKFTKTHGIKGELNAVFDVDLPLCQEKYVIIEVDGIFVPFFFDSIRQKSSYSYLIKFDNINSDKEAKIFIDKTIYLENTILSSLDEDNDYSEGAFADEFIDYKIIDTEYGLVGTITDIEVSTDNNLFIVNNNNNTIYIPITEDFIIDINDDDKTITMNLPSGLINLNN